MFFYLNTSSLKEWSTWSYACHCPPPKKMKHTCVTMNRMHHVESKMKNNIKYIYIYIYLIYIHTLEFHVSSRRISSQSPHLQVQKLLCKHVSRILFEQLLSTHIMSCKLLKMTVPLRHQCNTHTIEHWLCTHTINYIIVAILLVGKYAIDFKTWATTRASQLTIPSSV